MSIVTAIQYSELSYNPSLPVHLFLYNRGSLIYSKLNTVVVYNAIVYLTPCVVKINKEDTALLFSVRGLSYIVLKPSMCDKNNAMEVSGLMGLRS